MTYFSDCTVLAHRAPSQQIEPLFYQRWSPRAMSGEAITQKELMRLFEAARWAPSCYNEQPWRFIYAHKNTPHWQGLFELLVEFNQSWCANAAALVVVTSKKTFSWGEDNPSHSYDTGAAWQNIALQGAKMNLVVHGIGGFSQEQARTQLNIPQNINVEAMIAIGHPAPANTLGTELQDEERPSDRIPLSKFTFEGQFKE